MQAAILAGGKGTRLRHQSRPKALVEINGIPVLEYQLRELEFHHVKKITICLGYQSKQITDYIGKRSNKSLIEVVIEEKPLGTGGALSLIRGIEEDCLIVYGDIIFNVNLDIFLEFHRNNNSLFTFYAHPNDHPFDSDILECDKDSRVTKVHPPKRHPRIYNNLVSSGLYLARPDFFTSLIQSYSDLTVDIVPKYVNSRKFVYAYNCSEYVKDMGTPERLKEVGEDLKKGKVKARNLRNKQKAIFLDRDGTINIERDHIIKEDDFAFVADAVESIRKINASGYLAIIVTNQPAVAKGFCDINTIDDIHRYMETVLGSRGVKLDAIYYCPYHPEKGFPGENIEYKKSSPDRKPGTGMLDKAKHRFNIDFAKSFIIGDTTTDIMTGKNAGLTSILVKSGYAGKDHKYEALPNHTFQNLLEAINFILGDA